MTSSEVPTPNCRLSCVARRSRSVQHGDRGHLPVLGLDPAGCRSTWNVRVQRSRIGSEVPATKGGGSSVSSPSAQGARRRCDAAPRPSACSRGAGSACGVAELARRLDERSADIAREMAFMMAHEIDQLMQTPNCSNCSEASVQGNIRRSSTYWPTTFRSIISNPPLLQWNTLCVWRSGMSRPLPCPGLSHGPRRSDADLSRRDQHTGYSGATHFGCPETHFGRGLQLHRLDHALRLRTRTSGNAGDGWQRRETSIRPQSTHSCPAPTQIPLLSKRRPGTASVRNHVALVVWSTWDADVMGINRLDRLVRDLGAAAGADKPPIITAIDRRTVWRGCRSSLVPAPDPEVLATAVPLTAGRGWQSDCRGQGSTVSNGPTNRQPPPIRLLPSRIHRSDLW